MSLSQLARRSSKILLLTISLVSCSATSSEGPEAPPKELTQKKEAGFDASTSEEELFLRGKRLYSSGSLAIAKDAFELLLTNYAMGPYAEFAELKLADIEFDRSEFLAAAGRYESFVNAHPASISADYAIYRQAESYRRANKGVGRDPAPLEKSLATIQKLVTLYPDSVYVAPAQKLQQEVHELLAAHARSIAEFYERRGFAEASAARAEEVAKRWDPVLQKQAAAETERKNEADESAASSRTPLAAPPQEPQLLAMERQDSPTKGRIESAPAPSPATALEGRFVLERVVCDKDTVTIHLNRGLEVSELLPSLLKAREGAVHLEIPGAVPSDALRTRKIIPCFAADDLSISDNGTVALKTSASEVKVIALDYPPRIILIQEIR